MIKAAIFDCDGTLFSSGNAVEGDIKGIIKAYEELGISARIPTKEELWSRFGYAYPEFFVGIIPEESFALAIKYSIEETIKLVRAGEGNLFADSLETLKELKKRGLKLGVATNGTKEYIEAVAKTHGLDKVVDVFMSYEQAGGDKGDLVREELKLLKVNPNEAIMVGDRKSDIDAARKAGCRSVAVTYGYGKQEELENADFLINSLNELKRIVENEVY